MAEQTKNLHPCTFAYDSTGRILNATQGSTSSTTWDSTLSTATFDDNDTPTGEALFSAQDSYLIVSGVATLRPYFTLTQATASGITTVTATLENPPATPPTSLDFIVAGSTVSSPISSGSASISLAIDALVATQKIDVIATATGFKRGRINVGGSDTPTLQAIAPNTAGNTSSTSYRVTTSSKAYAQGYYMGQANLTSMAQALSDLQVLVQVLVHTLYNTGGVVNSLTQSTYTPITLSANEKNALPDIQTNLLPNLGYTLDTIYPSGGTEVLQYASVKTVLPNVTKSAQDYATFVANTPGLE